MNTEKHHLVRYYAETPGMTERQKELAAIARAWIIRGINNQRSQK